MLGCTSPPSSCRSHSRAATLDVGGGRALRPCCARVWLASRLVRWWRQASSAPKFPAGPCGVGEVRANVLAAGHDANSLGKLDLATTKMDWLRSCERQTMSMDATVRVSGKGSSAGTGGAGNEAKLSDNLAEAGALPDERAETKSLQSDIHGLLRTALSDRECDVVRLRFGLDDGKARTLEEIGTVFSITRERVRQIEARALHKLRQPYRNHMLEAYTQSQAQAA